MKKGLIVIITLLAGTFCLAGKSRSVKEPVSLELTEAEKVLWKDSLKVVYARANAAIEKGDSSSALTSYEISYSLASRINSKPELVQAGMYISKEYIKAGKGKAAEIVLEQVFAASDDRATVATKLEASDLLAGLFSSRLYFIKANQYLKASFALRDEVAIANQLKEKEFQKAKLEEQLKANELEWTKKKAAVEASLHSQDNFITLLYISIGALSVVIIALLAVLFLKNKKMKVVMQENELLLHNKKHSTAEMERLHRLVDETKNIRTDLNVPQTRNEAPAAHVKKPTVTIIEPTPAKGKVSVSFLNGTTKSVEQIEESLKKSDWQQIQRLIFQLQPQLLDAGMEEVKPILNRIQKLDGKSPYLAWHASVQDFCATVKTTLGEMQAEMK